MEKNLVNYNLDIPFKEFMAGQIIDPEQFNDDMLEIEEKVNEIVGKHNSLNNSAKGHIANKDNPHEVTAHQVGTYTGEEIDGFVDEIKNGGLNPKSIKNEVLADNCVDSRTIANHTITASKVDALFGGQIDISRNTDITDRYTKTEVDSLIKEKVGEGAYSKEEIDLKFEEVQAGQIIDKTIGVDKLKDDVGRLLDISDNESIIDKYTKTEVDILIRENGLPKDWGGLEESVEEQHYGFLPVANFMTANEFIAPLSPVFDIDVKEVTKARGDYDNLGDRLNSVDSQLEYIDKKINSSLNDFSIFLDLLLSYNVSKIKIIGDSISYGLNSSNTGNTDNVICNDGSNIYYEGNHNSPCWVNKFRDYVKSVDERVEFINAGIPGKAYWYSAYNLDAWIGTNNDVLFIVLGTNDCLRTNEGLLNDIRLTLDYAIKNSNHVVVLTPIPRVDNYHSLISNIDLQIQRVCSEKGVYCISMYRELLDYIDKTNLNIMDILDTDKLHPNDLGHEIYWRILQNKLGVNITQSNILKPKPRVQIIENVTNYTINTSIDKYPQRSISYMYLDYNNSVNFGANFGAGTVVTHILNGMSIDSPLSYISGYSYQEYHTTSGVIYYRHFKQDGTWTEFKPFNATEELTGESGWSNRNNYQNKVSRNGDVVSLTFELENGNKSMGTRILTLSEIFRPKKHFEVVCHGVSSAGQIVFGELFINADDGTIILNGFDGNDSTLVKASFSYVI